MASPTLEEMTTPESSALLLVELQEGVVGAASVLPQLAEGAKAVDLIAKAARLAAAARRARVAVVHCTAENLAGGFGVNHNARLFAGARRAGAVNEPGSAIVQPVPELGPEPSDLVLPRYHGLSPMTGSPLDSLLRNAGISTLVVAGVSLNVAVTNLVFDAVNRSYQVVVVTDAVVGLPVEYGERVVHHSLALLATLATTEQLERTWSGPTKGEQ